jgi:hypothetical protein
MTDLDLHVARLLAAGVLRAYKLGSVPSAPAYPYASLALDSGTPNGRTADAKAGKIYRLTVQLFGREADAVTDLARLADVAFEGVALTDVAGSPVCTREISTVPYRDPDDLGVLSILHTYRY